MEMLNIGQPIVNDVSVIKYEEREYEPLNPNLGSTIRIEIGQQDSFIHPHESFLLIEGRVKRGGLDGDIEGVALCNNAPMFLFSDASYYIGGEKIEYVANLGRATTMLGHLIHTSGFNTSAGPLQGWEKDTTQYSADIDKNLGAKRRLNYINDSDEKGVFSFIVPMKHIFGFCCDYDKIMYGCKHELILTRDSETPLFGVQHPDHPWGVELRKVSWFMPHVVPQNEVKSQLENFLTNPGSKYNVVFRGRSCDQTYLPRSSEHTWRLGSKSEECSWVIVGLQHDRDKHDISRNIAAFDHSNIRQVSLVINGARFPDFPVNMDFTNNRVGVPLRNVINFRSKFFEGDENLGSTTLADFKNYVSLFVIDARRQDTTLVRGSDIMIKFMFHRPPVDVRAFAMVITEDIFEMESNGRSFIVSRAPQSP